MHSRPSREWASSPAVCCCSSPAGPPDLAAAGVAAVGPAEEQAEASLRCHADDAVEFEGSRDGRAIARSRSLAATAASADKNHIRS